MSTSGRWLRTSIFWLLIMLVIVLAIVFIFRAQSDVTPVTVSTILQHIKQDMQDNKQDTLNVASDTITLTRGKEQNAPKESATVNESFDITRVLKDNNIDYSNNDLLVLRYSAPNTLLNILGSIGGFIPFLIFGILLIVLMRQAQGSNNQAMSFGKSRARMFMGSKTTVTFADVAGVEEAK